MNNSFKKLIINILPPFLFAILNNSLNKKWNGNYQSWQAAEDKTTGYDSELIANRVLESALKVKKGICAYERDSVLFDNIEYSWPLLAGLMIAAAKSNGKVNVLDIGGSLGSTYFQNKKILDLFTNIRWNIVEQQHFVKNGQDYIQDESLRFYESVDECLKNSDPNLILLSSVLQYLEEPYILLSDLVKKVKAEYIIVDRTPFSNDSVDRITIQTVNPEIYTASYPCWIFSLHKFKQIFELNQLQLIEEFDAIDGKRGNIQFKGFIFQKISW